MNDKPNRPPNVPEIPADDGHVASPETGIVRSPSSEYPEFVAGTVGGSALGQTVETGAAQTDAEAASGLGTSASASTAGQAPLDLDLTNIPSKFALGPGKNPDLPRWVDRVGSQGRDFPLRFGPADGQQLAALGREFLDRLSAANPAAPGSADSNDGQNTPENWSVGINTGDPSSAERGPGDALQHELGGHKGYAGVQGALSRYVSEQVRGVFGGPTPGDKGEAAASNEAGGHPDGTPEVSDQADQLAAGEGPASIAERLRGVLARIDEAQTIIDLLSASTAMPRDQLADLLRANPSMADDERPAAEDLRTILDRYLGRWTDGQA